MSEMANAGKQHCQVQFIRCLNYQFIPHRPTGMNHRSHAALGGRLNPVGEGEHGVRGQRTPPSLITGFLERKLKLRVNKEKSAVGRVDERTFLGYRLLPEWKPWLECEEYQPF